MGILSKYYIITQGQHIGSPAGSAQQRGGGAIAVRTGELPR